MVRTRAQNRTIAHAVANSINRSMNLAISEQAREFTIRRHSHPQKSPSKISKQKQQQKTKRNSEKYEKMLTTAKKNLAKADERLLPEPLNQPKTLLEEIHESIVSGVAKRNLKPVTIIID